MGDKCKTVQRYVCRINTKRLEQRMCSGVYFENDVLVFPNGYAMRNKLRQNLVDKPDKSDILNT